MLESYARKGYYAIDPEEKKKGSDILWFIWENKNSPVFGKDKMTTFERYFVAEKATHVEPKNAILRQYEKLLALDEVKLVFEEDALSWIAEEALKRGTGARALRAILEEFMLDIMYEIPKDPNIGSVVVTRPYLEKKGGPLIQVREG